MTYAHTVALQGRAASKKVAASSTAQRNAFLLALEQELARSADRIFEANKADVAAAIAKGLTPAIVDRLVFDQKRLTATLQGIKDVVQLPDPLGQTISSYTRADALRIAKVRVPLGVVLMIYEARPNVTVDAAVLCLKTGNAVILRGGSEALRTNMAIAECFATLEKAAVLPAHAVQIVAERDYEIVTELVRAVGLIDVVIPRGGEKLVNSISESSRIPVLKHAKGLCHLFVDSSADVTMAEQIAINAKVQRPGVCNAIETLLVHSEIASSFVPQIVSQLQNHGVEIRGCARTRELCSNVHVATEEDWNTEYLDLILSVRVVDSLEQALEHIEQHGSRHSESIVTNDTRNAERFLQDVDAAAVYVNASTRFTDGSEFGLGAEIGISTDKLHARGPMGLEELTTYKWIGRGSGQIR